MIYKLDEKLFFGKFPKKAPDAYKGSNGKILLISGSYGMAGAASLNILGAKALGAAYICVALPESIYPIVAAGNATPVFMPMEDGTEAERLHLLLGYEAAANDIRAVAFGSGADNNPEKEEILETIIEDCRVPMVLDAAAIRLLAESGIRSGSGKPHAGSLLTKKKAPVIVTPHIGEFSQLTGMKSEDIKKDPPSAALKAAKELDLIIVLKGPGTVVAAPDGRYFINTSGNQGLAQAGSGDVLTGMTAAMLSFVSDPFEAACMAVFAHGMAADELCRTHSHQCMPLEKMPEAMDALFYKHGL